LGRFLFLEYRSLQSLPESVDALIDELDKAFALRNFPVDTPHHAVQRELGRRDVVDFLRQMQRERDERTAERFGGGNDAAGQWSTR
jgi:hypothetical protein